MLAVDGETSNYADDLARHFKRTRNWVLLDAIRRGIRSVNVHLMRTDNDDVSDAALKSIVQSDPDAEPHLREVRNAKRELGALQIRFDDLLRHCPDAQERADIIERYVSLARQQHGSFPSMWGSGVSTEQLKKQLAALELEQPIRELPAPPSFIQERAAKKKPKAK